MENPLIPAGIEPATFRFVVQHLNHCATVVLVEPAECRATLTPHMDIPFPQIFFLYKFVEIQCGGDLTKNVQVILIFRWINKCGD